MNFETNPDPQNWLNRLSSSFGEDEARWQFDSWEDLQVQGDRIQQILSRYPSLDFSEALVFLARTANILRYDEGLSCCCHW